MNNTNEFLVILYPKIPQEAINSTKHLYDATDELNPIHGVIVAPAPRKNNNSSPRGFETLYTYSVVQLHYH